MKEDTRLRKKNVKGSVLFTVVAVMMVMIVFVMATLTLAGVANRRSYASYSKNQTTYTARSAVDSVYKALTDESATDFGKKLNAITSDGTIAVSGLDTSMGTVGYYDASGNFIPGYMYVELIPDALQQEVLDEDTNTVTAAADKDLLKITATAKLGDEDSTVSLYIIKNPEEPVIHSSFGGALTTMGGFNGGSASVSYGGATINLKNDKWDDKSLRKYISTNIINNSTITSDVYSVGSINCGSGINTYFEEQGQGFVVLGDLTAQDNGIKFHSNVSGSSISDYNKIPYVYVERLFSPNFSNGTQFGSATEPINLYVGGYMRTGQNSQVTFNSDIYIYNHDFSLDGADIDDSHQFTANLNPDGNWDGNIWDDNYPVSKFFNNGGSRLTDWCAGMLTNSDGLRQVGGNLYSKGCVDIKYNSNVGGDLFVDKDLRLENVTVGGSITCNGTMFVAGNNNVSAGLFVDPTKLFGNGSINGVNISSYASNPQGFIDAVNATCGIAPGDTSNKTSFPANRELKEILGYGNEDNQIVQKQEDLVDNYSGIGYSSIPEGNDVSTVHNVGVATEYNHSGAEVVALTGDTYFNNCASSYGPNSIMYIDSSCTLSGSMMNGRIIYINPGSNNLWIKLDKSCTYWGNSALYFTDNAFIVVNSNCTGNVNFFIDDNSDVNLFKGAILTSYYFDLMQNHKGIDIQSNVSEANKQEIPNINIYSGENVNIILDAGRASITGYILAPKAHLGVSSNAVSAGAVGGVTYNGQTVDNSYGVSVIGSAIVNTASLLNKDGVFYVAQGGDGDTPEPTGDEELKVLKAYYQNS